MRTNLVASLVACATAVTAVAGDGVDREKLKRVVELPSIDLDWWFYRMALDGRVLEGWQEPQLLDGAELSASLAGNETDAERWMDLALCCRFDDESARSDHALAKAVTIFRRRSAEHPDDGRALASLGLALVASGDDKGGESEIRAASKAKEAAWAGTAAAADLLVLRAADRAASRRFATLSDAFGPRGIDEAAKKRLDPALLDDAAGKYDAAVAAIESSGAIGPDATSVYARRLLFTVMRPLAPGTHRNDSFLYDARRAAAMQPSEPFAVLQIAIEDARPEPGATENRELERFDKLSAAARANVTVHLARLREMAASPDAETAARALQAVAYLQWHCVADATAAESSLRRSIEKNPQLRQSWTALTMVLVEAQRWNDLVQMCRDRLAKTGESRRNRLLLGKALWLAGRAEDAEKEWRAGLALDPKSVVAQLGVAALVIRRAKNDAELREAADLVRAAKAASQGTRDPSVDAPCRLCDAVLLALSGDVVGAEKVARQLVADFPEWDQAKRVLSAIGR